MLFNGNERVAGASPLQYSLYSLDDSDFVAGVQVTCMMIVYNRHA